MIQLCALNEMDQEVDRNGKGNTGVRRRQSRVRRKDPPGKLMTGNRKLQTKRTDVGNNAARRG